MASRVVQGQRNPTNKIETFFYFKALSMVISMTREGEGRRAEAEPAWSNSAEVESSSPAQRSTREATYALFSPQGTGL